MEHLGDITKVSGFDVPPVDCVIGGSPCQDLSVAGKCAGLVGARSVLFMEQIRIIKEMREADVRRGRTGKFIRPRFMVWENVPGAFSSNKGDDFRAVLEETIRVADPDAPDIPLPAKGKWPMADAWYGDGWSVAYRVLDAQFWGVPQRRRRIALVADFGGYAAPEILFVRESLCWDIAEGGAPGEEVAAGTGSGADCTVTAVQLTQDPIAGEGIAPCLSAGNPVHGQASIGVCKTSAYRIGNYYSAGILSANPRAGIIPVEKSNTLDCNGGAPTSQQGSVCIVQCTTKSGTDYLTGWDNQEKRVFSAKGVSPTLSGSDGGGGRTVCGYIYDARGNGDGKTACTMTGDHQSRVMDYTAAIVEPLPFDTTQITSPINRSHPKYGDPCHPLAAGAHPPVIVMATGQGGAEITRDMATTMNCNHEQPIVAYSLRAKANCAYREYMETYPVTYGIVRRLTPLECERLQGYPDGWTDIGPWTDSAGKLHKESRDSARYKALGNSIALPPWKWVLKRISAQYERDATMASLFDGIGGFPLIWERLNGPGSCLWASEIEEFPIAVTRRRFGGKED